MYEDVTLDSLTSRVELLERDSAWIREQLVDLRDDKNWIKEQLIDLQRQLLNIKSAVQKDAGTVLD